MKKSFLFLVFLSLLVSSCAGTKYKNTTEAHKSVNKDNQVITEDLDSSEEYVEYTGNYFDFDFDTDLPEHIGLPEHIDLAGHIIETAAGNLGVKYKYGGMSKSGFDCSGLVFTSFKAHNITLPRSSHEMAQHGTKIKDSETQKGDLIFFITNGGKRINHVGIVTEVNKDEIKFIHASTKAGVIISSTGEPYYKKNYVKVARVL